MPRTLLSEIDIQRRREADAYVDGINTGLLAVVFVKLCRWGDTDWLFWLVLSVFFVVLVRTAIRMVRRGM